MKYYIDIDNTICDTKNSDYENSKPYMNRIAYLNRLHDEGNEIHYWTARGNNSGIDWFDFTRNQLTEWGCKFTSIETGKPSFDLFIDDKAMNSMRFFRSTR